ncbi:carboxymuconolactone decarboxylase family protein [Actinomadura fibrosa]|uniref:Carboxymuconolactone decarboxylase family protein n=1 Tax=Actinomadura fibrosa TaxID=111802 RepID=A0ABW2Y1V1_9ACTN|nr:carboxymuconolactone decarboxylase family protein [Actinomadura fibrosa]
MTEPRLTNTAELFPELNGFAAALSKALDNGSVPRTTIGLVQMRAGQLAGSTYLTVRHAGALREAGEPEERITAVSSWQDAPYFTAAERAALALVEAVLTPNPHGERVPDELFDAAAEHYDATALSTLTMAIGQVCFFVPYALIIKPPPAPVAS